MNTHSYHTEDTHKRYSQEILTRDTHKRYSQEILTRDTHKRYSQEILTVRKVRAGVEHLL